MKTRSIASFLAVMLVLLAVDFLHAADKVPFVPSSELLEEPTGTLVLGGGGEMPLNVPRRFLDLAGGARAKLVIIPAAAADKVPELWQYLEPASVVLLHARDRKQADDPDFVRPLTEATGVWFEGTDVSTYASTAVERELRKLLTRGGAVGGTTAAAFAGKVGLAGDGLGLLPGAACAASALKRNRVDDLLALVSRRPGLVGFGVDEQTALVVQGRRIRTVGNGYVAACLPPSARRPASVQVLKESDSPVDLLQLQRSAIARALPPFPPEKPATPEVAKGALIIGGGGGMPQEVVTRFIDLAGGPDSLIVVVPTALEDPLPAKVGEVRMLERAGAKNVQVLHTRKRSEADDPKFAAPLREAKGIWFSGGRQWRFVDAYAGTLTEKLFHDVLARGGVIGGSSAGASIQTEYMPRGHPLGNLVMMAEGYERGFGFLPGVAVDQHFFARNRLRDMTALVSTYPQLLGIGIDEGTVIVVQGSKMEVVGKSKVAVYDRTKPVKMGEKDFEELPAGTKYDLQKRQRIEKP